MKLPVCLLFALLTACGGNSRQVSTDDFQGNCRVIGTAKLDPAKLDLGWLDEADIQKMVDEKMLDHCKVLVIETIDVEKPETHYISTCNAFHDMTVAALETAEKGEVYYISVEYDDADKYGEVKIFEPAISYGIPLTRDSYSGKAQVIGIIPSVNNPDIKIAILKTLDTPKPYLYHLRMPYFDLKDESSKALKAAEKGKTYYMEVTFTTSSRYPDMKKFSPV